MGDSTPWTGRADVEYRGLSQQAQQPNFLYETLDTRWEAVCAKMGMPTDIDHDAMPDGIYTDCRHAFSRQLKSGGQTLLANSLPFWHKRCRTVCPKENLRNQGFGNDVKTDGLAMPVEGLSMGFLQPSDDAEPPGKRRRRMPNHPPSPDAAMVDLAGNMVCIPDYAAVWYCAVLACESSCFEHGPPSLAQASELLKAHRSPNANFCVQAVVLDHTADAKEAARSVLAELGMDDDLECDECAEQCDGDDE